MGTVQLYTDYIPVIDGVVLPHITAVDPQQNLNEIELRCLGRIDPIDLAEAFTDPTVSFETAALDVLFSTSPDLGLDITDGLYGTSNTILQYQQATDGGGFQSGSNHFKLTSPRIFAFLESLRAEQDATQPAMARIMCHLMRTSTTYPNVAAGSASLTGSIALTNKYALGPLYVNDVAIAGLMSVELRTNTQVNTARSDGETVADQCRITSRRIELQCTFKNMSYVTSQGLGLSDAAGEIDLYLRHIPATGGRTADGTGSHIRINLSDCKVTIPNIQSGGQTGEAQAQVNFTLVQAGAVTTTVGETIPYTP